MVTCRVRRIVDGPRGRTPRVVAWRRTPSVVRTPSRHGARLRSALRRTPTGASGPGRRLADRSEAPVPGSPPRRAGDGVGRRSTAPPDRPRGGRVATGPNPGTPRPAPPSVSAPTFAEIQARAALAGRREGTSVRVAPVVRGLGHGRPPSAHPRGELAPSAPIGGGVGSPDGEPPRCSDRTRTGRRARKRTSRRARRARRPRRTNGSGSSRRRGRRQPAARHQGPCFGLSAAAAVAHRGHCRDAHQGGDLSAVRRADWSGRASHRRVRGRPVRGSPPPGPVGPEVGSRRLGVAGGRRARRLPAGPLARGHPAPRGLPRAHRRQRPRATAHGLLSRPRPHDHGGQALDRAQADGGRRRRAHRGPYRRGRRRGRPRGPRRGDLVARRGQSAEVPPKPGRTPPAPLVRVGRSLRACRRRAEGPGALRPGGESRPDAYDVRTRLDGLGRARPGARARRKRGLATAASCRPGWGALLAR